MRIRSLAATVLVGQNGSDHVMTTASSSPIPDRSLNIAIIGAGAAGASTAYHLNKYAVSSGVSVNMTVFERNSYIGGRSTTVLAYGDERYPVELGASIFVEVNQILKNAVDEFGLSTMQSRSTTTDIPGPALAVWDGHQLVVTMESDNSWWNSAKLLWRYGLAPVRTIRLMKSVVGKFLKMYQKPHFPFRSLTQVAQDVGLQFTTSATGELYLAKHGIAELFAREIVQASTRVNYAQNLRYIHGLEAMVCMAAENAMSVSGGNWQIFSSMVNASRATTVLGSQVTQLNKQANGTYLLGYQTLSGENQSSVQTQTQLFDTIILAAPFHQANISFSSMVEHIPKPIPYVNLHVTLFTSPYLLSPLFFGMQSEKPAPRVILTTLSPNEHPQEGPDGVGSPRFFSLSLLRAVTNPITEQREYLYKMFSAEAPKVNFLSAVLDGSPDVSSDKARNRITWIYRKLWQSYPYEYPRADFERLRPDGGDADDDSEFGRGSDSPNGLWYTSGMESFISTMETSALMGANVARIIVDNLRDETDSAKPDWKADL